MSPNADASAPGGRQEPEGVTSPPTSPSPTSTSATRAPLGALGTLSFLAPTAPRKTPRRFGRIRTELLSCQHGEIADLSASGMRVLRRSRRAPNVGDKIKVKLRCLDIRLKVQGVVVWVRTEAPGLHVVGLHFVKLTPELNERLVELCAVAGVRRTLGPRDIRGAA